MKLVDKMNFKAKNCSLSYIFFERILHVKKPMHFLQQPYVLGLWISGRLFYICTGAERQSKGGRAGSPRRESRTRGKGKGSDSPFPSTFGACHVVYTGTCSSQRQTVCL